MQEQMQMQHTAGPSAAPAHLPEQFQMHPQQEQDGSYTMYLSEVTEEQQAEWSSNQGYAGAGRRKLRAVRGRRGGQGSSAGQQEEAAGAGVGDDISSLLELLPPNKR